MADSFESFVRQARPALYRLALALCAGQVHQAEDLEQAVLERLYVRWPLTKVHDPVAYAKRALVHEQASIRRRAQWRLEALTREVPQEAREDRQLDTLVEHLPLIQALGALPPRQRQSVVLHHLEDLTVPETARLLGCSPGTVKRAVHDGLKRLKTSLEPLDQERDLT